MLIFTIFFKYFHFKTRHWLIFLSWKYDPNQLSCRLITWRFRIHSPTYLCWLSVGSSRNPSRKPDVSCPCSANVIWRRTPQKNSFVSWRCSKGNIHVTLQDWKSKLNGHVFNRRYIAWRFLPDKTTWQTKIYFLSSSHETFFCELLWFGNDGKMSKLVNFLWTIQLLSNIHGLQVSLIKRLLYASTM